jgi:hypothetical protein
LRAAAGARRTLNSYRAFVLIAVYILCFRIVVSTGSRWRASILRGMAGKPSANAIIDPKPGSGRNPPSGIKPDRVV